MNKRLMLAVVLVLAVAGLVVAGVFARGAYQRWVEAKDTRETAEDKAIIDFVYDSILPQLALDAGRACPLPSRELAAVVTLKTHDGAVEIAGLDHLVTKDWTEANKQCITSHVVGTSKKPSFTVPPGREYEIDVSISFGQAKGVPAPPSTATPRSASDDVPLPTDPQNPTPAAAPSPRAPSVAR